MSDLFPVAGARIYIGDATATQTADFVAGDFSAVTWVEIDGWETMGGIGDTIRKIDELTGAIASAVEEQGAATSEIARNVEEAAQGANEVASVVQKVAQAAEETGKLAENQQSVIGEMGRNNDALKQDISIFLTEVKAL